MKRAKSNMSLRGKFAIVLLFTLAIIRGAGWSQTQVPAASQADAGRAAIPERSYGSSLPIAPGDLIRVDIFGAPDLSGRYRVSQAGDVDLILAGKFHLAGLTSEAAAIDLEGLLRAEDIVKNPHVNVFVQEYLSQGVTVLGEVKNPGVYPSLGEHRLYDLIASAGGFTTQASNRVTILRSGVPEKSQVLDLGNMALTDGASNVVLGPGDRVVVGSGGIVYVMGDVGRAGGFVLSRADPNLTVIKALALAGGFNYTAKTKGATILAQSSSGVAHRDFDLQKVMQHKAPDIVLNAGDVLYIPRSTAKIVGYRSIEAMFSAATQAAVYVAGR